jgi:RHH-type proline utilization regulon transcriptional repressor/proline dehydrogenase/delta 1-pyrroline-5-carboxylate dehydrogenase
VIADTIQSALRQGKKQQAQGYLFCFDMLGEEALTQQDADRYTAAYAEAIRSLGQQPLKDSIYTNPGISIKLSALHPRYQYTQQARLMAELLPRLIELTLLAKSQRIGLSIDAEEADRLELSLNLFAALAAHPEVKDWNGLGLVIQAYQKRAPAVIDWLVKLARQNQQQFMVRLVKGAYWDTEIKRAQVGGLADYPVFTRKYHTDLCYLHCANQLLQAGDVIYPQFATHNAYTLAAILALAGQRRDFECQALYGMGETLYDHLLADQALPVPCRIYAPVGDQQNLLAYLVRRLLENGANSSFVHQILDKTISVDQLTQDPAHLTKQQAGLPHPHIPQPRAIYGPGRVNALGLEVSDTQALKALQQGFTQAAQRSWKAQPLLATPCASTGELLAINKPHCQHQPVGQVRQSSSAEVGQAITDALAYHSDWAETSAIQRALCLQKAADLLTAERADFIWLAIQEAGKTIPNGVAEVREAIDFCRYYAQQVTEKFSGSEQPLGTLVCISPWNFPLAIFIGQVSAALATGNSVIAKPAEQTPLLAAAAVDLLHRAGVPKTALQLLPGKGETIGANLVADQRMAGVIFTGSTEVARQINQTLASHTEEKVLIAETGGQNAMIVDSSALLEQVVKDVIKSAFDSAGQRCSALRVLFVQADIGDPFIAMLKGAMAELQAGDPEQLATDIGPVIDKEAQQRLLGHIDYLTQQAQWLFQTPLTTATREGTFVPPTLCEITDIAALKQEVFGPVLHLIRYQSQDLPQIVQQIKATGYGLTFGIHSRVAAKVEQLLAQDIAGNVYVNRDMVGAVVGVQPFGGTGKSGTGPKAGGPYYLQRLIRHQPAPELTPGKTRFATQTATQSAPQALQHSAAVESVAQSSPLDQVLNDLYAIPPLAIDQRVAGLEQVAELLAQQADHMVQQLVKATELSSQQLTTELEWGINYCRYYAQQAKALFTYRRLIGPTGEENRFYLSGKGLLLTLLLDPCQPALLTGQIAAVLVAGNSLVVASNKANQTLASILVDLWRQTPLARDRLVLLPWEQWQSQLLDNVRTAAVLWPNNVTMAQQINQQLSQRPGAITPLIRVSRGKYPKPPLSLLAVTTERSVSINTTAAGGNTALMALTEN